MFAKTSTVLCTVPLFHSVLITNRSSRGVDRPRPLFFLPSLLCFLAWLSTPAPFCFKSQSVGIFFLLEGKRGRWRPCPRFRSSRKQSCKKKRVFCRPATEFFLLFLFPGSGGNGLRSRDYWEVGKEGGGRWRTERQYWFRPFSGGGGGGGRFSAAQAATAASEKGDIGGGGDVVKGATAKLPLKKEDMPRNENKKGFLISAISFFRADSSNSNNQCICFSSQSLRNASNVNLVGSVLSRPLIRFLTIQCEQAWISI